MIQTEVNWHFYQDVHWSSSAHLFDERQRAKQTINALSTKSYWLQLQDNVLIWQAEHQDQCINSLSQRLAQRFQWWMHWISMNHYSDVELNEDCWSKEEHQQINL